MILAILAHFRPTLANWVILSNMAINCIPIGTQHMGKHYMGPIGGVLVQNRGLEGENCFKT